MTRITVDQDLLSKLLNLTESLELHDSSGQLLGRFSPIAYLEAPQFSEEELRRREQSDKWYTTPEVLARLEKL